MVCCNGVHGIAAAAHDFRKDIHFGVCTLVC